MKSGRIGIPRSELFAAVQGHIMENEEVGLGGRAVAAAIWYARLKHGDQWPGDEQIAVYAGCDRATLKKYVVILEGTNPPKLKVTRRNGWPNQYDLLDRDGRSMFDFQRDKEEVPEKKKEETPKMVGMGIRPFTDAWTQLFKEFFKVPLYKYGGSRDTEGAKQILSYCSKMTPPLERADELVLWAWREAKEGRFSPFVKERIKTIAGFAHCLNDVGVWWAKRHQVVNEVHSEGEVMEL